ncbi:hypothetical protein GCM10023088_57220 [Actinomadura verrucosospora]|uniref:recombinase family protein n=2 Tax=Actinomadura TaxID=1988 RepID=UPI0031E9398E
MTRAVQISPVPPDLDGYQRCDSTLLEGGSSHDPTLHKDKRIQAQLSVRAAALTNGRILRSARSAGRQSATRGGSRLRIRSHAVGAGNAREKVFAEKVSTRVRIRPEFENALEACRQIKARAPHCRVILTVYEMKRLGRDSAELTALADHLTAHGIALEMLAGPLTGTYDPSGTGRVLFAFFAAMAEEDMLHTVLRRRFRGESVEDIRSDLIIPTGKRKGQSPSPASIYRALAEHDKRQRHPETV